MPCFAVSQEALGGSSVLYLADALSLGFSLWYLQCSFIKGENMYFISRSCYKMLIYGCFGCGTVRAAVWRPACSGGISVL